MKEAENRRLSCCGGGPLRILPDSDMSPSGCVTLDCTVKLCFFLYPLGVTIPALLSPQDAVKIKELSLL